MKPYAIALLLQVSVKSVLFAQSVLTGVVSDSLNVPIPFTTVYLSKTTIGTFTDNSGYYSLAVPVNGAFEMVVSCVGYRSYSQIVHTEGDRQTINIRLGIKPVLLDEIVVRSRDRSYQRNYSRFIKLFIGETFNSQSCKILNPGDLRLHMDTQKKVLKGYSVKPLRIENRALGYTLIYDLTDFNFEPGKGSLRFAGNFYFQPLKGTIKENEKWRRERLIAYYGSRMHFLRALFSNSLIGENFILSEYKPDGVNGKYPQSEPIPGNKITKRGPGDFVSLYNNNPVNISYAENHPELATGLLGFDPRIRESTLLFADSVRVFQNGFFDPPYSVTWEGEMAVERIAEMLPWDFRPDSVGANRISETKVYSLIEKYLFYQQKSTSSDQVFVHLDRNLYRPGDTIRFQAYIRDRFSYEYVSKSVSLYAMLFFFFFSITDSSRFKINNSTSSGWMAIPGNAKPGKYHFAVFTSLMQNFDPADAFQLDLLISGLKASKEENADPGKKNKLSVTKNVSTPTEDQNIELGFLPEGGTLVSGLEQRIGFNATNINGKPVYIQGLLKTSSGATIDTIKSGIYGPGLFECTPQPGMYVELTKGAAREKTWLLPDPVPNGICLSVKPVSDRSFSVEIQSDSYNGDTVNVTGIMNLIQIFSRKLILDKKQRIIIDADQLPQGIAQITLFDKNLRPVAERLFYVNADKHLNIKINTGNHVYSPGEETELTISVTDETGIPVRGIFSIAVIDSLSGHDAEIFIPGIEYTFNYHPFLAGNLPPKVLATGLENLIKEEGDLMLMVYGWSKYNYDFSQAGNPDKQLINFDLLKIKILSESKNKRAGRRLDLISLEGPSVKHLILNENGEISLPLDSLPEITRSVTMMPDIRDKKRVTEAMLSIPYFEQYFKSRKLSVPQPVIPSDEYDLPVQGYEISMGDSVINIPEVTIKGYQRSKPIYQNIYEDRYKYANIKSSDPELLERSIFLETAIRTLANPVWITEDGVYLRGGTSFFGPARGALFVLDGMPLYKDGWQIVKTFAMDEIASITVLKGNQGRIIYGLDASGGVIFINTMALNPSSNKLRTEWKSQNKNDNMRVPVNIYRQNKEFYCLSKSEIDADPALQNRSTIFWDPEVYFDGKEPVKIKYTNLRRQGPVKITINAVSVNNLAGTGRAGYLVSPGDKK